MKGVTARGAALTAAFCMVGILLSAGTAPAQEQPGFTPVIPGIKMLEKGSQAPLFKLKNLAGADFDFALKVKEQPHMIIFFSIFCEPCREEMPVIEQVYHEFKEQGLDVVAILMDGPPFKDALKTYVGNEGYSFTFLIDEMGEEDNVAAGPYQVPGTPVLYLVDGKGNVFDTHLGRISAKDLRERISSMLQGG